MKRFLKTLMLTLLLACGSVALTGCDDGDDWDDWYWGPDTQGYYYDPYLVGSWTLIQVDGQMVPPGNADAFDFLGRGMGTYHYYSNGIPYSERISYWCAAGINNNTLTLSYANGSDETVNFWFTENYSRLWMNWRTTMGTHTYIYARTN